MRGTTTIRRATRRGFTLLEAVTVVAMMAVVALMVSPYLAGDPVRKDVELMAREAVDALREARSATMTGLDDARHGVHFEASAIVGFSGAAYVPGDPGNLVRQLPAGVAVTAVSLSPGGSCDATAGSGNCDVHFASRKGIPIESGTITLSDEGGTSRTVTINAQGMIEMN